MKRVLRAIFSRYFISGLLIALELSLLLYILIFASRYSVYAFAAMIVIHIFAVLSIVNREANPEYKVSWLVVVLLIPIFGVLLYSMFYSRRVSESDSELMQKIYHSLDASHIKHSSSAMHSERNGIPCEKNEHICELSRISPRAAGRANSILFEDAFAHLFRNCKSDYFSSGEEMYTSMLLDIEKAESFIFLEYFIVSEGVMWSGIYERLCRKVREGVEVRLICDDVGCMRTLPHGFEKKLHRDGIEFLRFCPITPRISVIHNNRDHRKILVIDGCVAYTGGVNISDEYINEKPRFGHWKDGGIRIEGEAATGFLSLFLSIWDLTARTLSEHDKYFGLAKAKREILLSEAANEKNPSSDNEVRFGDDGFYIPFSSGPAPLYRSQVGKNTILATVNQACDYVYITTPYLIIDYDLTEALCAAARRGVDVRIITPAIPDKKLIKLMTKSAYPQLISNGVRIYEYTPGFIHEKLIASDDRTAVIGTINLDYRSLAHHFENALWMYGTETVLSVRDAFLDTVSASEEIDRKDARLTFPERLIRSFVRIFAPLL